MGRIAGFGPVKLDTSNPPTTALTSLAGWSLEYEQDVEAVKNLRGTVQDVSLGCGQWSGEASWETPKLGFTSGVVAVGSWAGAELKEYTFSAEMTDIGQTDGPADEWKYVLPGPQVKWKLDVSKWQATDSLDVFLALLATQIGTPGRLTVTTPYSGGSSNAVLAKGDFEANGEPGEEKISIEGAGVLTSSDTYVGYLLAQAAAMVANGYLSAPYFVGLYTGTSDATPRGGEIVLQSVEHKVSAGKIESSIKFTGNGELSFG